MTVTPCDLADGAAEAIRAMNHLTRDGQGLEYPSDVYDVVASVKIMSERLPQLFGQLTEWLWAEHAAGRVGHDSGGDAGLNVAGAESYLADASAAAHALYDALNSAHTELASLRAVSR